MRAWSWLRRIAFGCRREFGARLTKETVWGMAKAGAGGMAGCSPVRNANLVRAGRDRKQGRVRSPDSGCSRARTTSERCR